MKIESIFMVMLCSVSSSLYQPDNLIKTNRINDRVVTFDYLDVNVTAIKSRNGIIVIDTHRSPATMVNIMKLIEKEFGRNDFKYILNTHGDYDHCSGNQVFQHAIIIGHENCPEYMRRFPANTSQAISYFRQYIDEMKETLKKGNEDPQKLNGLPEEIEAYNQMLKSLENEYKITPPMKTFKDSLILDLDDLTLKIFYCGKAHTDNDIMIYIPEEKLVFTGDLFTTKYNFGFGVNEKNDVQRVISTMNLILQNRSGLEYVIPGHGNYMSGKDFSGHLVSFSTSCESFRVSEYLQKIIVKNFILRY
jgi:cyclase